MVEQRADNAQTVDRNHQEAPNLNTLTLESWAPLTRHRKVSFSVVKFGCSYTVIRGRHRSATTVKEVGAQ